MKLCLPLHVSMYLHAHCYARDRLVFDHRVSSICILLGVG